MVGGRSSDSLANMPCIVSRRWSGEEHTSLQRAGADPDFQRLAIERGFPLQHLKNWIRDHDVPVTYRAGIRAILNIWTYSRANAR